MLLSMTSGLLPNGHKTYKPYTVYITALTEKLNGVIETFLLSVLFPQAGEADDTLPISTRTAQEILPAPQVIPRDFLAWPDKTLAPRAAVCLVL